MKDTYDVTKEAVKKFTRTYLYTSTPLYPTPPTPPTEHNFAYSMCSVNLIQSI